MSLWTKPVTALTFDDVEQFCLQKIAEGVSLDYKREVTDDLAKLVSSFANTVGGWIIFGVDGDSQNLPKWPTKGIPTTRGFADRIIQICGEGITPPIMPAVSAILESPNQPGVQLAVVRIDQSHEAPHSLRNKPRTYIRTGSVNTPIDLADIPRIEQLLRIRGQAEARLAELRQRHLRRYENFVARYESFPTVWWHFSPMFPSRSICSLDSCLINGIGATMKGPEGAWGTRQMDVEKSDDSTEKMTDRYVGTTTFGDLFVGQRLLPQIKGENVLQFSYLDNRTREVLFDFNTVLRRPDVIHPGTLQFTIGFSDVLKLVMGGAERIGRRTSFPDETLEITTSATYEEFLQSNLSQSVYPKVLYDLLAGVAHAFNIPLPGLIEASHRQSA